MWTRSLLVGLLLAAAVGQVVEAQSADALLAGRVVEAVREYAHFSIFDEVTVSVSRGAVRLDGRVTAPFKRAEIGARVARVPGVREVTNEVEVLPLEVDDFATGLIASPRWSQTEGAADQPSRSTPANGPRESTNRPSPTMSASQSSEYTRSCAISGSRDAMTRWPLQ